MGDTYNPIVSSGDYSNGFFAKIPYPEAGFALVMTGGPSPLVIQGNRIPTKGQLRRGQYNRQVKVDISPRPVSFEAELLSRDSISKFHASVSMTATVESPEEVVAKNITDVSVAVRDSMLYELQDFASRRSMEEITQLREEILRHVGMSFFVYGIRMEHINLRLLPDAAYAKTQADLRDLEGKRKYEAERSTLAQELSEQYSDPVKQVFAEVAAGRLSPSDAARQLQKRSAENFDENVRKTNEIFNLLKTAQDVGAVSPGLLENTVEQVVHKMLNGVNPGAPVQEQPKERLTDGTRETALFAPPEDEADED